MPSRWDFGTMLIVEGDVTLAKVLSRALARDGLTIVNARNAVQALQLAEQHTPRLVLLDCGLRDGDGLELAQELHRRFSGLPVIAMADCQLGVMEDSTGAGCFARVLTKSVNLADLRQAVDAALHEQDAEGEAESPSAPKAGCSHVSWSALVLRARRPAIERRSASPG